MNVPLKHDLIVKNKKGLHARPAAMIVRLTNQHKGDVFVEKDNERINGKSIMGLMMLAANKGSKLVFTIHGENPNFLADKLTELFEDKFGEK